jgi:hypothetical protein
MSEKWTPSANMKSISSKLKVGEWVEVRSKEEILRTLDAKGRLDGMPFMPEMFAFCGKRFQVYKRAHKTCDTVFPVRGRRVDRAIHLETRCDGSAHGGCQAGCLLFWKDAWLKPVAGGCPAVTALSQMDSARVDGACGASRCTQSTVLAKAQSEDSTQSEPVYVCQATQLPYATQPLEWWDIRQYLEDYRSGNVGLWQIFCGAAYFLYYAASNVGIGGRRMRWFYDKFHPIWRGTPFPRKQGTIPDGQSTPTQTLDLKPGELVRIKSYSDILRTLDSRNRNRGLYFDAEEIPYCGGTYRVLRRVTKIINERTGKMKEMKNPCIVLDSVVCPSRYSECRVFCPRSIYAYWREIWLERVGPKPAVSGEESSEQTVPECEPASRSR